MNDKNIVKEIYEKEKDKISISYDEFILLIEQLHKSFENINLVHTDSSLVLSDMKTTDNLTIVSADSSNSKTCESEETSELQESSKTFESIDTDNTYKSINTNNLLYHLALGQSKKKTSDIVDTTIFENDEQNILNFINIEEDNLSKKSFKSSSKSQNVLENIIETLSYPSKFTSENDCAFFDEFSISSYDTNKSQKNKQFDKQTQLTDTTKSNKSNKSNKSIESNRTDIFLKNEKIAKKTNKINIKVNPNIEYSLNIDINNDICISIG